MSDHGLRGARYAPLKRVSPALEGRARRRIDGYGVTYLTDPGRYPPAAR